MTRDNGMDAGVFAGLVFDAIARGEYWIIPQPDALDSGLAARNTSIAARRSPQFYSVDEA